MTLSKQQRDADWTKYHYLALHIIREGLHFEDGSVPPALEDLVDDAIAYAWQRFERICETHPDAPAKSRVRWAAKTGVLRVRSGRRFASTRPRGYVDALDHRSPDELQDAQDRPATEYRDPSDNTLAEEIIAKLPAHLQAIARLCSYGMTKDMIAERRGISRSTLYSLIGELRNLIPAALPEAKPAETETEPVRRFRPVRSGAEPVSSVFENRPVRNNPTLIVDVECIPVAPIPEPAPATPSMTVEDYLLSYAHDLWRFLIGKHGTVRAMMVPE